MFIQILSKISVIFLLLLIGALAKYRRLLTEEATNDISKVVVVVTLPFLYFYTLATQCSKELLISTWMLPLAAVGLVLLAYLLGWLVSSFLCLDKPRRNTFIYLSAFTNCGFLAIPVAFALFGQQGVVRVVIFNVGYSLLLWTLGIWTLSRSTNKKKVDSLKNLINTGTIALLIGLLAGSFSIKLPSFFLETSDILGKATIPLALLVVGAILAGGKLNQKIPYKTILSLITCRLIIVPAVALGVTSIFNMPHLIRAIIVLQAAMPSASTTPLFIRRFGGGDSELAASGVFFTTLFSIITVPVFLSLV
ncbi:MAG: AEC family transporter [Candidatus Omnitrophota bacterium]|nr:AEC family transporter [Candidatus Omnitrophota bacterium]